MPAHVSRPLSGWGRHPRATCAVLRPERRADVAAALADPAHPHMIARGLGRSYGDAALDPGGAVVEMTRLDRMLAFDEATGVLVCEAGVSLAAIIEVFLPRGWFPAVTPGTKHVTVGGAIAHDVHGKNHHRDGSFAGCTLGFTLLTPSGELVECARDRNPEVFWATLGGAGLTGVVLLAAIRLRRVESAHMRLTRLRAPDVEAALAAFVERDAHHQYSVAWIDCLARGRALGRSVMMFADHAPADAVGASAGPPLSSRSRRPLPVPCDMPSWTLNRATVGAFNAAYWASQRPVTDALVGIEPYFYPLDRLAAWNRLYGRRGFVQYQVAFPQASGRDGLVALLERLSAAGAASFLAVLKRFGPAAEGPLSFPLPGYTLALDLPMAAGLPALLRELDALVLAHGGRFYLGKDATATPEAIAAMYPRLAELRAVKARLDPQGRLSSALARRLGLA